MGEKSPTHTHQMDKKIFILGEAWGREEERQRLAFVGLAGDQLNSMLDDAKIKRSECHVTNVFNFRPYDNKITELCGTKDQGIYGYPSLTKSGYVRAEYIGELNRLAREIDDIAPNIIVCLGNTASWAMWGRTAISKYRGTTDLTTHTAIGYKGLATFHPAAINYAGGAYLRPTAIADLMKAKRESGFPEIRRPKREIWINPTLDDLREFDWRYLQGARDISIDIETVESRITCIGFGTRSHALVIPFADTRSKSGSYWTSLQAEQKAWGFVREIAGRPCAKVFQNGLYDIAFLWRMYGIRVRNPLHDTMLLHHALQPESLKALGYLGSIYTDEGPWKTMRENVTTIKRDE